VTLTDQLPSNMTYVQPWTNWVNGTGTWTASYSTVVGGPYTAGDAPNGQAPPFFLRWTLNVLGPSKSGCVNYTARVM